MPGDKEFGLRNFVQGIAGGVAGFGVYPVATTPRLLRRLPRATKALFRALWRENRIGPNLKSLASAFIPVGVVLVPPVAAISSALYGMLINATAYSEGFFDVWGTAFKEARELNEKAVTDMLPRLEEYQPVPLPEGKKPFDISPYQSLRGLVSGVTSTVIGAPLIFGVTFLHLPKLVLWTLPKLIRKLVGENVYFIFFLFCLGTAALGLALVLAPLVDVLFNLGVGVVRGYTRGLAHALSGTLKDTQAWDEFLRDVSDVNGD